MHEEHDLDVPSRPAPEQVDRRRVLGEHAERHNRDPTRKPRK
jgi:hypothetical protein